MLIWGISPSPPSRWQTAPNEPGSCLQCVGGGPWRLVCGAPVSPELEPGAMPQGVADPPRAAADEGPAADSLPRFTTSPTTNWRHEPRTQWQDGWFLSQCRRPRTSGRLALGVFSILSRIFLHQVFSC